MISVGVTILEDWIKHDSFNTALKKLESERIFKLMKNFVNDLYGYGNNRKQEENNEEESVDGEES